MTLCTPEPTNNIKRTSSGDNEYDATTGNADDDDCDDDGDNNISYYNFL